MFPVRYELDFYISFERKVVSQRFGHSDTKFGGVMFNRGFVFNIHCSVCRVMS
jgi:hypothetical protein